MFILGRGMCPPNAPMCSASGLHAYGAPPSLQVWQVPKGFGDTPSSLSPIPPDCLPFPGFLTRNVPPPPPPPSRPFLIFLESAL